MISIQASSYYLETTESEEAQVTALFEGADIPQHRYETTLALAIVGGTVAGALTESGEGEWSLAVSSVFQGSGIATKLVRAVIAEDGSGFLVAGTEDGLGFLFSLHSQLTEEERECLEVPSWATIEEMEA